MLTALLGVKLTRVPLLVNEAAFDVICAAES